MDGYQAFFCYRRQSESRKVPTKAETVVLDQIPKGEFVYGCTPTGGSKLIDIKGRKTDDEISEKILEVYEKKGKEKVVYQKIDTSHGYCDLVVTFE
jgi:hypothetical protein